MASINNNNSNYENSLFVFEFKIANVKLYESYLMKTLKKMNSLERRREKGGSQADIDEGSSSSSSSSSSEDDEGYYLVVKEAEFMRSRENLQFYMHSAAYPMDDIEEKEKTFAESFPTKKKLKETVDEAIGEMEYIDYKDEGRYDEDRNGNGGYETEEDEKFEEDEIVDFAHLDWMKRTEPLNEIYADRLKVSIELYDICLVEFKQKYFIDNASEAYAELSAASEQLLVGKQSPKEDSAENNNSDSIDNKSVQDRAAAGKQKRKDSRTETAEEKPANGVASQLSLPSVSSAKKGYNIGGKIITAEQRQHLMDQLLKKSIQRITISTRPYKMIEKMKNSAITFRLYIEGKKPQPTKIIGAGKMKLGEVFYKKIITAHTSTLAPQGVTKKRTLQIRNAMNEHAGDVTMFIRMTSFGRIPWPECPPSIIRQQHPDGKVVKCTESDESSSSSDEEDGEAAADDGDDEDDDDDNGSNAEEGKAEE